MMLEILTLVLFACGGWFWLDSMRARESALDAGRRACLAESVQFLDDTVALSRLRLKRDDNGRVQIARSYEFEFSDTGDNRRKGTIHLAGARLLALNLDLPERLHGLHVVGDERSPNATDKRLH
jgi:hypothetical protein